MSFGNPYSILLLENWMTGCFIIKILRCSFNCGDIRTYIYPDGKKVVIEEAKTKNGNVETNSYESSEAEDEFPDPGLGDAAFPTFKVIYTAQYAMIESAHLITEVLSATAA